MPTATEEKPKVVKQKDRTVIIWINKLRFHLTEDEAFKLVQDIYYQITRRL